MYSEVRLTEKTNSSYPQTLKPQLQPSAPKNPLHPKPLPQLPTSISPTRESIFPSIPKIWPLLPLLMRVLKVAFYIAVNRSLPEVIHPAADIIICYNAIVDSKLGF
jgi:hypothetical protein